MCAIYVFTHRQYSGRSLFFVSDVQICLAGSTRSSLDAQENMIPSQVSILVIPYACFARVRWRYMNKPQRALCVAATLPVARVRTGPILPTDPACPINARTVSQVTGCVG